MNKTAKREGLVGFSGRYPRVFHAVRSDYEDRSMCAAFTQLDFFFDYAEIPQVNEEWATSLTPCRSCFGDEASA